MTFHAQFLDEILKAIVKRPDVNLLISSLILKVPQPKDPCFVANVWFFGSPTDVVLSVPVEPGGAQCVKIDFTRTFQANAKCNNLNHIWSNFY